MPATINIATQDILSQNLSTNVYFTLLENLAIEGSILKVGTRKSVLTNTSGVASVNLSIGNYLVEILNRKFNIAVVANTTYNLVDIINLPPLDLPSRGLPTGGTTGQVLVKNSGANYDVKWVEQNGTFFNVKNYGAVGDGVADDTVAIQEALDACNAVGGGMVFFPYGTYAVDPSIGLNVGDNTIVTSDGSATIKIKQLANTDGNLLKVESKTNVKILNLKFDGNEDGQTSGTNYGVYLAGSVNCQVEGVTVYDFNGVGLQVYNCDDCIVTNNTSYSNGYHGFECEQNRGCIITHNVGWGNSRHGFYIAPGEIGGSGSKQCIISNNVSRNNGQYGIAVGVSVIGSTYLTQACIITGNQVYENAHYGISLYQQDQQIVTNNIIRNNGFAGIHLYQSRLNKIEGNYIQNNSASANNAYDEIQIEGGSDGTGSQNNTIAYNTIITNNGSAKARYGIREAHALDTNNIIEFNTFFDTPATGFYSTNSKVVEFKGGNLQTNGVVQTNSGSGSSVQSGYAGIDGEFGIMRVVNNKGNVPTQYVNTGTGNQEWYINGVKELEINTSNISAENNQIKNLGTPTASADATTKSYVDGLVAGLLDYRGGYNASSNTYPTTGGSGTAGAVVKGDMWVISVAGVLGGVAIQVGDSIIANIDTPGQTSSNWNTLNTNVSYVSEDQANKSSSYTVSSITTYANTKALVDGLAIKANIAGQTFTGTVTAPQYSTGKQTFTPTGTTQTIDWNNGSIIDLTLSSATGNVTLTLSNPVSATTYLIEVTNGATARNLIFPAGTLQAGGGSNTYVGIANTKDLIAVLWDGTNYFISSSRNYS